jgi:hypothetical protein
LRYGAEGSEAPAFAKGDEERDCVAMRSSRVPVCIQVFADRHRTATVTKISHWAGIIGLLLAVHSAKTINVTIA